jgi:protoheme IX farnesyltransferase
MLPVVSGLTYTAEQIVRYAWLLVSVSLLLFPAAQAGVPYLASAVVLGGLFVRRAYRLRATCRDHAERGAIAREAMRVFGFSITYLALLFTAVAVDAVL